jgi:hypothetical protein
MLTAVQASGQRGVTFVCARNTKTGDIMVMEIRFDRTRMSEREAADWWERNQVRRAQRWR